MPYKGINSHAKGINEVLKRYKMNFRDKAFSSLNHINHLIFKKIAKNIKPKF